MKVNDFSIQLSFKFKQYKTINITNFLYFGKKLDSSFFVKATLLGITNETSFPLIFVNLH